MSSNPTSGEVPPPDPTLLFDEAVTRGRAPAGPAGQAFGEYELLGELGRGGMGVVYKAREAGLDRLVALKMILPGALATEDDLQRFQSEAAAAARLQHPHIVTVHRVGRVGELHFFTMDFIDGPSLTQRLAQGPLPGRVAARYVAAVARAIHHAHQQGILHRDLKPANILLDADDRPHVTDFGLAKHFTSDSARTRTGAILGTPSYMAPEQAGGSKALGPACDVYGLGALLYELLTARPPFKGETPLDTLQQVLQVEPAPPRLLNPRVERDLETLCLKCLAKEPAQRYASAQELAEDLERYLQGESIHARSLNVMDRLARTLQRSQLDVEFSSYGLMLMGFAAIVLAGQVAVFLLLRARQPWQVLVLARASEFVLLGVVFWHHRGHRWLPRSLAERQLWSVWLGYLIACSCVGEVCREMSGAEDLFFSPLYPCWSLLAGLAFFVLGSQYWGGCYAVGLVFFAASVLMTWDLTWAPLEFGLIWAATLGALGLRLHRLGRPSNAQVRMQNAE